MARNYKALTPTPGTGIPQAITTSFSALAAVVHLRNPSSLKYRPQYIRLINTVVGASSTRSEGLVALDSGSDRYSGSGGSTLSPVNADMSDTTASSALVRAGALVMNAESSLVRRASRFQMRTALMVQFEEWLITFGDDAHVFNTLSGTAGQRQVVDVGSHVVGPGQDLLLHIWNPGNAATPPQWEVEVAWSEGR